MQVQKIQNSSYNTQFRGTLDKSVDRFIVNSIKSECRNYVNNLDTSANTKVLNQIKEKWMKALDTLRDKTAFMHKDTTVKVVKQTIHEGSSLPGCGYTQIDWLLLAENSKLNRRYTILNLDSYNSYSSSKHITSGELKGYAEVLNPQLVDKIISVSETTEVLNNSKCKWYKDEEINSKLNNLIEYKQEIGENDSEELIKTVNKNRAKIKAENLENEQQEQINKKNSDILNRFFEKNL